MAQKPFSNESQPWQTNRLAKRIFSPVSIELGFGWQRPDLMRLRLCLLWSCRRRWGFRRFRVVVGGLLRGLGAAGFQLLFLLLVLLLVLFPPLSSLFLTLSLSISSTFLAYLKQQKLFSIHPTILLNSAVSYFSMAIMTLPWEYPWRHAHLPSHLSR